MSPWLRENAGHYWYETRVVDGWLQLLRNDSATVSMAYAWQRFFNLKSTWQIMPVAV